MLSQKRCMQGVRPPQLQRTFMVLVVDACARLGAHSAFGCTFCRRVRPSRRSALLGGALAPSAETRKHGPARAWHRSSRCAGSVRGSPRPVSTREALNQGASPKIVSIISIELAAYKTLARAARPNKAALLKAQALKGIVCTPAASPGAVVSTSRTELSVRNSRTSQTRKLPR